MLSLEKFACRHYSGLQVDFGNIWCGLPQLGFLGLVWFGFTNVGILVLLGSAGRCHEMVSLSNYDFSTSLTIGNVEFHQVSTFTCDQCHRVGRFALGTLIHNFGAGFCQL